MNFYKAQPWMYPPDGKDYPGFTYQDPPDYVPELAFVPYSLGGIERPEQKDETNGN